MLNSLWYFIQRVIPQKLLSKCMGRLADSTQFGPAWVQLWIKAWIRVFGIDMQQAVLENPEDYQTFNQFFTRDLKPGTRDFTQREVLVSPCDGTWGESGNTHENQLFQLKGMPYSLEEMFSGQDSQHWQDYSDGSYASFYLSPKDYHWVHAPCGGQVVRVERVKGALYSVGKKSVEGVPRLFARNERILFEIQTSAGKVAVFMIGALVVGGITPVVEAGATIQQHDKLGNFHLGSSVVIVTQNKQQWKDKQAWETIVLGKSLA